MGASWKLLKAARILLGITQQELAEAAGVSRGSVDRLEKGMPGTTRIDDAIQAALERHGIKFLPPSEISGGGLLLPISLPEPSGRSDDADVTSGRLSTGEGPMRRRARGYTRRRTTG